MSDKIQPVRKGKWLGTKALIAIVSPSTFADLKQRVFISGKALGPPGGPVSVKATTTGRFSSAEANLANEPRYEDGTSDADYPDEIDFDSFRKSKVFVVIERNAFTNSLFKKLGVMNGVELLALTTDAAWKRMWEKMRVKQVKDRKTEEQDLRAILEGEGLRFCEPCENVYPPEIEKCGECGAATQPLTDEILRKLIAVSHLHTHIDEHPRDDLDPSNDYLRDK